MAATSRRREARLARAWTLALAITAIAVMTVAPALAQNGPSAPPSEADKARAVAKYDEGVAAFQKKRYKDAVDAFLAADAIARSGSFAYNIMLAYEQMGDRALSLRWAREYLRRKPSASDAGDIKKRCQGYEAELQQKGVQQITVLSNVAGATALIDGKPVGVTPWTGEIAPGNHKLALQMRGYNDAETLFTMAETHAMDVTLELSAAKTGSRVEAAAPDAAASPDGPPRDQGAQPLGAGDSPPPGPRFRAMMWAGFAVGAAALIAGAATGVASLGKQAAIRDACPTHSCAAGLAPEHDRVIALANASNAMFVVAGAGIVVGIVGWVLDRRPAPPAPPADGSGTATVAPVIGPGSVGLAGSF